MLLYIVFHLITTTLPCTVFWEFSSCFPAQSLKATKTTCSSTSPLIPSRMFLLLIVDQHTFSHVLNLFLTATITENCPGLSFCGCLYHLCLHWSGWNNAGWASSAYVSQVSSPTECFAVFVV